MYGIDANLIIYVLEQNPEFCSDATQVFKQAADSGVKLSASHITIMEVLSHKMSDELVNIVSKNVWKFGIQYAPVTLEVLQRAAALRRNHTLGAMDAIHVASAIENGCTHFITNDRHILRKKLPSIHILSLKAATKLFV